jgi:DNA-binding XRE family transcriptional regulator
MDRRKKTGADKRNRFLEKLGAHIAQVRKEQHYTQDRLYLEAGFSRGTLSKIERGLVNPQIWTLEVIAKTIGVPLSKLVIFKRK